MDEDILYIWNQDHVPLILLALMLALSVVLYCVNKISHYNEILPTNKGKKFSYLVFLIFGSAYALISYFFLMPYVAFPIGCLVLFAMIKTCYQVSVMQCLFFAYDFLLIPQLTGSITSNLSPVILNQPLTMIPDQWIMLEPVFAFVLASIISFYLYRRKIIISHWRIFIESNHYLRGIISVQSYFIFTCIIITTLYGKDVTVWFSVVSLLLLIGLLVVYLILIDYVVRVSAISMYEKDKLVLEEQLHMQIDNYNNQIEYIQEVRKFKHDFIPLLNTLSNLMYQGQFSKATELLNQTASVKDEHLAIYQEFSNNLLIQAIINNAYHDSLTKDITLTSKVYFPSELKITDIDLCRILTNLIKNAMEACEYVDKNKQINIDGYIKNNWFILDVSNSFDGTVNIQKGHITTRKENKPAHNLGLQILSKTTEKYGGFVKTNWTEHIWCTSIYLPF